MKYLKKFNFFGSKELFETNNINLHETVIEKVCDMTIPDPEHGDFKLSVFPFENTGSWISLPEGFKIWEKTLNEIAKRIPLQEGANTHYVTIDSKFFTKDEFLRREGIHADGNFCVDPKFKTSINEEKSSWGGATWGGARFKNKLKSKFKNRDKISDTEREKMKDKKLPLLKSSWGGATWGGARFNSKEETEGVEQYKTYEDNSHVSMDWVLPYKIVIPIGDYISEKKGGIFSVSSEPGCQGWQGKFKGEVLSEGSYDMMLEQLTDDKKVIFEKDNLYFMSSNTPHETLLISKGKRRTFMRVTLNHEYMNENIKL